MKVQVTFDVSDHARMGIAMVALREVKLASRDVCRVWLEEAMAPQLASVELTVEGMVKQALYELTNDE